MIDTVRNAPGVLAVRDKIAVRDGATQPASELRPVGEVVSEGNASATPVTEPEPVVDYQGGIAPFSDAPVVPPYSWPSYTPYNNFASLAYQTQYPSGAWPFIGPPYPYPMIPSGWRRVSLTWKKGYWWMRFHAHYRQSSIDEMRGGPFGPPLGRFWGKARRREIVTLFLMGRGDKIGPKSPWSFGRSMRKCAKDRSE